MEAASWHVGWRVSPKIMLVRAQPVSPRDSSVVEQAA